MTNLYRVGTQTQLHHSHPLHWSRFYVDKQRIHRDTMARRQDLILFLAKLHQDALKSKMPRTFVSIELRLTSLREWDKDYRVVLDHFFDVTSRGYYIDDEKFELSTLRPRVLPELAAVVDEVHLEYQPPDREDGETLSKVYIQQANAERVRTWIEENNRHDLRAAAEWLLAQPEVNFRFVRAGKLGQRDTSIWPVAAIETWPSVLRKLLFGDGIDIDAAYTQFLVEHLSEACPSKKVMELSYPDILRSLNDKKAWREELCRDTLGLEITPENIGVVKRICMSLANGSKVSPAILTGSRAYSTTADIISTSSVDPSVERLTRIGKRLHFIFQQYASARKLITTFQSRKRATRASQKNIFSDYFIWEREARYKIWNAIGQTGIMVHDGIDGVPAEYLADLPRIMNDVGIKLS